MDTQHIILIFFYGQFWRSLSIETQTPPNTLSSPVSLTDSRHTSARLGETKGNATLTLASQLAITHTPEKPPASTRTPHINSAKERESSDGSMIAALIIGAILTSMMIAIVIILLWKCSKKSAPADPNWAGRSPFADGDTPDMILENFKEMDQATKRTSIFSMLPWKLNKPTQGTASENRSEISSCCNTKEKSSQSTPTVQGDSGSSATTVSVSTSNSINVPSPPVSDEQAVCDPPLDPTLPPPEPLDLPPPPPWLNELQENCPPEISQSPEFQSEAQTQFPPPPLD
uniref:EVI2B n=1 Tax=Pelusios castaneus TaxID=367368 RepID=A0A8C8RKM4_9SAUR